jgi:hypothetical protein
VLSLGVGGRVPFPTDNGNYWSPKLHHACWSYWMLSDVALPLLLSLSVWPIISKCRPNCRSAVQLLVLCSAAIAVPPAFATDPLVMVLLLPAHWLVLVAANPMASHRHWWLLTRWSIPSIVLLLATLCISSSLNYPNHSTFFGGCPQE